MKLFKIEIGIFWGFLTFIFLNTMTPSSKNYVNSKRRSNLIAFNTNSVSFGSTSGLLVPAVSPHKKSSPKNIKPASTFNKPKNLKPVDSSDEIERFFQFTIQVDCPQDNKDNHKQNSAKDATTSYSVTNKDDHKESIPKLNLSRIKAIINADED